MKLDIFLARQLNQAQQEAVATINKNLLVLAGAGSGKTRVITAKIVHLIRNCNVSAQNILAITFTNKAAIEMKERAYKMLEGVERRQLYIKTFHAFGLQLLRIFIRFFKHHTASFAILDAAEQRSLAKKLLAEDEHDPKLKEFFRDFIAFISKLKQRQAYPGDANLQDVSLQIMPKNNTRRLAYLNAYKQYQKKLQENNRFDFDDLIALPVKLLLNKPEVKNYVTSKWRYVLVDEYQDVDSLQETLVKFFAASGSFVTVVGDDSQSIYGFRGAQVENILNFHKRISNSKVVMLEENYRSTPAILQLSNQVILNNPVVYEKKLFTSNANGALPLLRIFKSDLSEAKWVVENIVALLSSGTKPGEIAIFYRANAQSRLFEEMLVASSVPYKIIKGRRFYERKEIKAALTYLQFLLNPQDTLSLAQVINFPTRGIGPKALQTILAYVQEANASLSVLEVLKLPTLHQALSKKARTSLQQFASFAENFQTLIKQNEPAGFIVEKVINQSGLLQHFSNIPDEYERADRLEALKQLGVAAQRHIAEDDSQHPLVDFLRFVMLSGSEETEELEKSVHLITLHNAKGLEYENVHIVGLEEEVFPHILALNEGGVEEERRLLYVGITRAKKNLFLSAATLKNRNGNISAHQVSRFVHEFPQKLLHRKSDFEWLGARDGLEIDEFF